jgi:hypothetical protein
MTSQPVPTASELEFISADDIARISKKLSHIFEFKPDWVHIKSIGNDGVLFSTLVQRAGGEYCFPVECLAFETGKDQSIAVREPSARYFPTFCPERHINEDSTFCVGLRAGKFDLEKDAIVAWWEKLRSFVILQQTANSTGKWNPRAAMRHGEAGDLQLKGEEISRNLDCAAAFGQALQYRSGPLYDAKLLVRRKSDLLVNGRMECPCGRMSKNGRPYLRTECRKRGLDCLARILAKIDIAERQFWENHKGKQCCGTMRICPLKDVGNQPLSALA